MLSRPKPKEFTQEEQAQILKASAAQTAGASGGLPKSFDENFPVFEVPINQKVLIYVPNHVTTDEDGVTHHVMDVFCAHQVRDNNQFGFIRCTDGVINERYGLDGTCPLCKGVSDCWTLYTLMRDDIARTKGIIKDEHNPEAFKEAMKEDSKKLLNDRAIREKERWYTFPIVVIECEEKDGKKTTKPKVNAEGKITGTPCWYQIREATYSNKWEKALNNSVDENGDSLTNAAGQWLVLDFTVNDIDKVAKSDQKMRSAKELQVTVRTMPETYKAWETYFDELTAEWTPAKAMETCALNAFRDMSEMHEAANSILQSTNERITQFKLSGTGTPAAPQLGAPQQVAGSIEDQLAGFGNVGVSTD